MGKVNARLLIEKKTVMNGLKCYGKPMNYPDLQIGDIGHVEEFTNRFIRQKYPDKTHWFKPKKWKNTWHFPVKEGVDFEFL